MLLFRSPSLVFAFTFSIFSILLTIITFPLASQHSHHYLQFLIVLPPLNSIFLFLFSLTWIERRFRLTYIPFLSLIILVISSSILTIISILFLSLHSCIIYINLGFHLFSTLLFSFMILILIFFYIYGLISINFSRNFNGTTIERMSFQSSDNELVLHTSSMTNELICNQIESFLNDLSQLNINTILTLSESREFRTQHSSRKARRILDNYSMQVKRAEMQHLIYSIRAHFIPRSISDYMQFLYTIIRNISRSNQSHFFIHSMSSIGRNQMMIVSLDLLYDYLIKKNQQEKFVERFFHYPFRLPRFCRVCQSIGHIQQLTNQNALNPVQIYFLHEFYARLKTSTYMEQIRQIIDNHEKLLLSTFDDLQLSINI